MESRAVRTGRLLWTGLVVALLCMPIVSIVLASLANTRFMRFPHKVWSLQPYRDAIAQDLTYTVGWLLFGLGLLAAGIYRHSRAGRMAAVALIAVTMFKAFLYDMGSLGGLYRVASLVGLAISLSLVALALQKFVLQVPKARSPSVEPNVG